MAKQAARRTSTSSRKKSSPPSKMTLVTYEPSHEEIAQHAYGLYLARGAAEGGDFDDWVRAESELRAGVKN